MANNVLVRRKYGIVTSCFGRQVEKQLNDDHKNPKQRSKKECCGKVSE
jgi:hypothetical protein